MPSARTASPCASSSLLGHILEPLDLDSTGMDGAEPLPWSPAQRTDWVATSVPGIPGYSAVAFSLLERKGSLAVLTHREEAAVTEVAERLLKVLARE